MKATAIAALLATSVLLSACGEAEQATTDGAATDEVTAAGRSPGSPAPSTAQRFTIADAERVGFVRGDQQLVQIIGASDGWGGTLAGDEVELYSFADTIPREFLRNTTQPGNAAGWAGFCQVRNLVVLYKREESCNALRQLIESRS